MSVTVSGEMVCLSGFLSPVEQEISTPICPGDFLRATLLPWIV